MADDLESRLAALRAKTRDDLPEAARSAFDAGIEDLIAAGVAQQAPAPGDKVADFTLPDSEGRPVDLAGLRARGPVVVSFCRGHWCPYCTLEMQAWQTLLPDIRERGAELIAISPETGTHGQMAVRSCGLAFPMLSDRRNAIARRWGLVFQLQDDIRGFYDLFGIDLPAFNGDDSWELPVPGTFVVDRQGCIAYAFANPDYTRRAEPADILATLDRLA